MYKQKGTGRARHGARRRRSSVGGGKAFGPVPRSHAYDLPKKVRALALQHALSAKAKDGALIVLDDAARPTSRKTKALQGQLRQARPRPTRWSSAAPRWTRTSASPRATSRISTCCRSQGINVYDILRRDTLVLTRAAVEALEERFR